MLAVKFTQNRIMQGALICFAASLFFAYELMQLHMLNAISPMLMRDLHLSATDFGVLGSTYLLADVIFLLPAGIILDRFEVRRVILTALMFCIAGTVGFAMSTNLTQACIAHFFSGIGNAFCFLSCMLLVSRWFPSKWQATVMGLLVTMGLLGGVMAQTPFSMMANAFEWRGTLMIDAGIGLVIFGLIFLFVADAPVKEVKVRTGGFLAEVREALTSRQNICCGLYTGFMNLPVMLLGAMWGSLFLTQIHGFDLPMASFVTSMICMGTIFGSPLFGWLADRNGSHKPMMLFGAIASIGVFALIAFVPNPTPLMMTSLFFGLGFFTSTQVLGYPLISEAAPASSRGTSMGIAAVIIMGMAFLLNPISGFLIDLNWDGTLASGTPLYSYGNFLTSFAIFPIAFILSALLVAFVRPINPTNLRPIVD